jgi:hypothetical protein
MWPVPFGNRTRLSGGPPNGFLGVRLGRTSPRLEASYRSWGFGSVIQYKPRAGF